MDQLAPALRSAEFLQQLVQLSPTKLSELAWLIVEYAPTNVPRDVWIASMALIDATSKGQRS